MDKPHILSQLSGRDILSKGPIVEIAGQNRVLIENHQGILGYATEEIQIKVTYGKVCIFGNNLMLQQISKEQLVITGNIEALKIIGR